MIELIGVIIVFNPDLPTVNKILANSKILDKTIIVDNSNDGLDRSYLKEICDQIISEGKNLGLGRALNLGIDAATQYDECWVVTLDQDSLLPCDYKNTVAKKLNSLGDSKYGVLSPVHTMQGQQIERLSRGSKSIIDVQYVMMSGNLVSIEAFNKCGGFDEDLFIDYVDVDFCMKIRECGFKTGIIPELKLDHMLGESRWFKIGGLIIKPTHHNYIRRFYITRNRTYIALYRNYPVSFKIKDGLRSIKEVLYILLFEDNKISKLTMIFRGFSAALRKELGEIK